MFLEIIAALGAVSLMQGGHSAQSAARTIGRVAGRAAGSIRRARAEISRVQQRAQAAGGAELKNSSAELAKKVQQLRMIQAETSALLRVRPSTLITADGRVTDANTSEFTDEELYEVLKEEMIASRSSAPSGEYKPVHASPLQPPAAGGYKESAGHLQAAAVSFGSSAHVASFASPSHRHVSAGVAAWTASSAAPPPPPARSHGQGLGLQAGGTQQGPGRGQQTRGAALVAGILQWEDSALRQKLAQPVPSHVERDKVR